MTTTLLVEHVQQSTSPLRVDRDRGVIHSVKLLGWKSSNGRTYSEGGVDASMYDGRPVNVNHLRSGQERSAYDRLGVIRNPVKRKGGVYGDLHLLKSHPLAPAILEAAERMPEAFGMSHTARGRASSRGDVIERVEEVVSCDVVGDPATTRGLHESRGRTIAVAPRRRATMPIVSGRCAHDEDFVASVRRRKRLEEVRRRVDNHGGRPACLLAEMCEMGILPELGGGAASGISTPSMKSPAGDPEAMPRRMLRAKLLEILDNSELTLDDAVRQIVQLLKSNAEGDQAAGKQKDEPAEESRRLAGRLSGDVPLRESQDLARRLMRA